MKGYEFNWFILTPFMILTSLTNQMFIIFNMIFLCGYSMYLSAIGK